MTNIVNGKEKQCILKHLLHIFRWKDFHNYEQYVFEHRIKTSTNKYVIFILGSVCVKLCPHLIQVH